MIQRLRRGAGRLLRRVPHPAPDARLQARLDEQDAAIARLRLALDEAVLALDRRMLDHYALTELARAELKLRADAIDRALSSPDGPVAELLAAEAALLDSYLIHHVSGLARQIDAAGTVVSQSAPGLELLLRADDFDVVVPSSEQGLVAFLVRHGAEAVAPGVRAVLGRELRAGGTGVDVGAAAGLLALTMAAAVGPDGHVICFEPVPRLAGSLRRTLALNAFASRAEVSEIALADTDGVATFHVAEHGPMSSFAEPPEGISWEAIDVVRTTLDQQIPAGTRVDLVALDVVGAEPLVWRGAERVRRENQAIVFLMRWDASLLTRAGADPLAVMSELRGAGFSPFLVAADDASGRLTPLEHDPATLVEAWLLLRRA